MDEFNEFNYCSDSNYNLNNSNFNNKFSLNNSMKFNNYINPENNEFENYQMINNNINRENESVSLFQIKRELDTLNSKMNIISQALYNLNLFNNHSKKKINLKKSSSMNYEGFNNYKNKASNNYNQKCFFNNSIIENNKNYKNEKNNIIKRMKFENNNKKNKKYMNANYNDNNNDYYENGQNYSNNYYFSNSLSIPEQKINKKIKNIKYSRNNSIKLANTNKNFRYTCDEAFNGNNLVLDNKTLKKSNDTNNAFFGIYDRYFIESLTNNDPQKEEKVNDKINNNQRNIIDIMLNKSKKISNKSKSIYNNGKNIKKNFISSKSKNDNKNYNHVNNVEYNKNNDNSNYINNANIIGNNIRETKKNNNNDLHIKKESETSIFKNQILVNELSNQNNKNKLTNEKSQKKEDKTINNEENIKNQNKKQLSNNEMITPKEKEEKNNQKNKNEKINLLHKRKNKNKINRKTLSFHEEDNITLEYNKKDEITKINVFDFFGENQNFQPRNINVILEKLKRKKTKTKPILLVKDPKKNLRNFEKLNESGKLKKFNSLISIYSNKEKNLLSKYKLKKSNSNPQRKNYTKGRNKICEKFINNPQSFYSQELCDLEIKSFDREGIYLRRSKNENKYYNNKKYINDISNEEENMTDIDINIRPIKYLQRIIEEDI